jgi:SAM-dependent methyltransferase
MTAPPNPAGPPDASGSAGAADHRETVRQSFRRQVGLFSGPDSPFARRNDGWLEPLSSQDVVLEVACGAAHVAESIAGKVRTVIGLDLTKELLALGAGRLRAAGVTNVVLQEGDAEAMPFVDGMFDVVYCRASLHHMAVPAQAVREMARVCRPGGRVVVNDLVAPAAEVRDVFDHVHRLLDPSHARAFLEDELPAALPPHLRLTHGETTSVRFPVTIAYNEQSDVAAVEAALRADLAGGPPTGLEPTEEEDGRLVVAFTSCTIEGTVPPATEGA